MSVTTGIATALAVAQTVISLAPTIEALFPAAKRAVAGEATPEDIAALEAGRDVLNARANDAEQRVIDQAGTTTAGE